MDFVDGVCCSFCYKDKLVVAWNKGDLFGCHFWGCGCDCEVDILLELEVDLGVKVL